MQFEAARSVTMHEASATASVRELEAALAGDAAEKFVALGHITQLVDAHDDSYEVQRELLKAGVFSCLLDLLRDGDSGQEVAAQAARVIATLVSHSQGVQDKLAHSNEIAIPSVAFNPLQLNIADLDLIIEFLVKLSFSDNTTCEEAAEAAISAICSYNRTNTIEYLRRLVHCLMLGQGGSKPLEKVDAVVSSLEMREDAAVVLDQALMHILSRLRKPRPHPDALLALKLLGTICEKRPAASGFLVAEGALEEVVRALVNGDLPTKDCAAFTLWHMVQHNRQLLASDSEALPEAPLQLVDPLMAVIHAAAPEELPTSTREESVIKKTEEVFTDNSDEAVLLLKTLASLNSEVAASVKDAYKSTDKTCVVM